MIYIYANFIVILSNYLLVVDGFKQSTGRLKKEKKEEKRISIHFQNSITADHRS